MLNQSLISSYPLSSKFSRKERKYFRKLLKYFLKKQSFNTKDCLNLEIESNTNIELQLRILGIDFFTWIIHNLEILQFELREFLLLRIDVEIRIRGHRLSFEHHLYRINMAIVDLTIHEQAGEVSKLEATNLRKHHQKCNVLHLVDSAGHHKVRAP